MASFRRRSVSITASRVLNPPTDPFTAAVDVSVTTVSGFVITEIEECAPSLVAPVMVEQSSIVCVIRKSISFKVSIGVSSIIGAPTGNFDLTDCSQSLTPVMFYRVIAE